jgi:hypothetical protein
MADNVGATVAHRALNYLGVRYPGVYATAADAFGRNCSLRAEVEGGVSCRMEETEDEHDPRICGRSLSL